MTETKNSVKTAGKASSKASAKVETETKTAGKASPKAETKTVGGKPRKLRSSLSGQQFYCLGCRVKRHERSAKNICYRITKNGKYQLKSRCNGCKRDLYKFAKEEDAKKYNKC